MFIKYKEKMHCFISRHGNMAISQAMIIKIESIESTHEVLFTNKYIIKCICILKFVEPF